MSYDPSPTPPTAPTAPAAPGPGSRIYLRRALVYGAVALLALVVGHELARRHPNLDGGRVAAYALALLTLVAGVAATRSAAREVTRVVDARDGGRAAAPLRIAILVVGYLFTLIAVFDVLQVDLSEFLLGGALTGVVLGIAAQQALGNVFAGIVLLLARPYTTGQPVTVFNGSVNGPHQGVVVDVGLVYTTLRTSAGDLRLPNSILLASAVGPATPVDPDRQWTDPPVTEG